MILRCSALLTTSGALQRSVCTMMEVPGDGDSAASRSPPVCRLPCPFHRCVEFHLELAGTHLVRPVASQARFIVAGRQPSLAALRVSQSPFSTTLRGAAKPVPEFPELATGDYSICALPITGDMSDMLFQH